MRKGFGNVSPIDLLTFAALSAAALFSTPPQYWSPILQCILLVWALYLFVYQGAQRGTIEIRREGLPLPLALFLGLAVLYTVVSLDYALSRDFVIQIASYVMVYFLSVQVSSPTREFRLALFLMGLGTAASLYGIYQYLWGFQDMLTILAEADGVSGVPLLDDVRGRLEGGRVFSTFLLPSHCAAFLGMTLAVSVGVVVHSRTWWGKETALGAVALQVTGLYLTKSFSGFVSFIAAASAAVAVYMMYVKHMSSRRVAYVGVGAVVVLMVVVVGMSLQRADNPFASLRENPSLLRVLNWEAALRMIVESPWAGRGLHTFGLVYPSFQKAGVNVVHHAHNSYLQVGVEMGVAGMAVFVWFAGWWIWRSVKSVREVSAPREGMWRSCLCAAGLAFLIHNALDFEFYLPSSTLPGFAVLALGIGSNAQVERMRLRVTGAGKAILTGAGIAAAILVSLTLLTQLYGRMHFDKARYYLNAKIFMGNYAAHELEKAIDLDPHDSRYYNEYGVLLFKGLSRRVEGIAAAERAVELSPRRHYYHFDLGMMYLLSGDRRRGIREIEQALALYPGNDTYREVLERLRRESPGGQLPPSSRHGGN